MDLGLWWQPARGGAGMGLTTGVGEHTEPRVSADGRRVVATLVETRQALMLVPVRFDRPAAPTAITDGYSGDLDPSLDPGSNRIVFSSSRSGNRNLWIARADGTGATPLTTESSIDSRPAFSPDGQQIAFVSDRGGRRGIWTIGAEGGTPRFVGTANPLGPVSWSPGGASVFYATPAGDLPLIERMSLADGRTSRFATPRAAVAPVWAPATRRLAYIEPVGNAGQNVLMFMNEGGDRLFPAFPRQGASINNGFLAWSPDAGSRRWRLSGTAR